ncbi:MAG: hypothetical protein AB1782_09325 [Cyanobacteriota bacterium]
MLYDYSLGRDFVDSNSSFSDNKKDSKNNRVTDPRIKTFKDAVEVLNKLRKSKISNNDKKKS